MSDEDRDRQPVTDTRQIASAVRVYMEGAVEEAVRQMKYDGATLEDCEAELQVLSDFVRAQKGGLRAAWPELLEAGGFAEGLSKLQGADDRRVVVDCDDRISIHRSTVEQAIDKRLDRLEEKIDRRFDRMEQQTEKRSGEILAALNSLIADRLLGQRGTVAKDVDLEDGYVNNYILALLAELERLRPAGSMNHAISWELDEHGAPTLVVLVNIGDVGCLVPFAVADLVKDPVEAARRLAPRITSVLQNGDSRRFDFR